MVQMAIDISDVSTIYQNHEETDRLINQDYELSRKVRKTEGPEVSNIAFRLSDFILPYS